MDLIARPVAGIDYPRTLREFDSFFPDEEACRAYLARLRWAEGFACRKCRVVGEPWRKSNGLLRCRACRAESSVIAGTVLQDTKMPLRAWMLAAWQITSHKHGVSALSLQRVLGLGNYRDAWSWLHKLRRAMVVAGRERLKGTVQVDETWVGAPSGRHGRGTTRTVVVVAAEEVGRRVGRIRLKRVSDSTAPSLLGFIRQVVEPGSIVHTDGWQGYSPLKRRGYEHKVTVLRGNREDDAHKLLPHVHIVASLLKRWLIGIHHGAASQEHLDYYLDEFTFRFNRRTSRSRGLLFYRLLHNAVCVKPAPYKALIHRPR